MILKKNSYVGCWHYSNHWLALDFGHLRIKLIESWNWSVAQQACNLLNNHQYRSLIFAMKGGSKHWSLDI